MAKSSMRSSTKHRDLHPKPLFDEPALSNFLSRYNAKEVHKGKIWRYMLQHPDTPLDQIPHIPDNIRQPLREEFAYLTSEVIEEVESAIDGTIKLLIRLQDGGEIEAVMIHHSGEAEHPDQRQADRCGERDTLCISSQVGCKLGCTFCATGTMGLQGNLWSGEIQEQLVHASKRRPISNVVFMGMGEPLENYDGVAQAIRGLTDTGKFQMAPRSITVSTVGIVGKMYQLMDDLPQVKMAISLHAPTQELREEIVPVAKTFKLDTLMGVLDEYSRRVTSDGKRKGMVMVSYVLLEGVNDSEEHARQLLSLLKDRPRPLHSHVIVNLIPYNPFEDNEHAYRTPSPERVDAFLKILEAADVRVFERRHHGRDIAAACGQLAKIHVEKQPVADIESCSCKLSKDRIRKPSDGTADRKTPKTATAHHGSTCWLAAGLCIASFGVVGFLRWRGSR